MAPVQLAPCCLNADPCHAAPQWCMLDARWGCTPTYMPAYKTTAIRVNAVTRPGRWLDARSHINASGAANVNTIRVANKEWQPHPVDLA